MYLHKLFDSVAAEFWDEDVSFTRVVNALGFDAEFIESDDPDDTGMSEDDWFALDGAKQEEVAESWNPTTPVEGFSLAMKYVNEDGELMACFVKPRTEYARILWEIADVWSDGEEEAQRELKEISSVGSALEFRREQMGWDQQRMMKELGIFRAHYEDIISGRAEPPLWVIRRAFALGVPATVLLQEAKV